MNSRWVNSSPLDGKVFILAVTYVVGSSVSILGTLSILICLCRHTSCKAPLLFQLCLADFIASVLLLYSSIMQLVGGSAFFHTYRSCQFTIYFVFCFYACTFCLTMIYSYEVYHRICSGRSGSTWDLESSRRHLIILYILSWGVPISVYVGMLLGNLNQEYIIIPNDNDSCTQCLPVVHQTSGFCFQTHHEKTFNRVTKAIFMMYFGCVTILCSVGLLPVVLFIIVKKCHKRRFRIVGAWNTNVIVGKNECLIIKTARFICFACVCAQYFYCVVRRSYGAAPTQRTALLGSSRERETTRTTLYFQLYFLVCWSPVMLLCILSFVPQITDPAIFSLHLLQAITMPLQGAMISLVYGWSRRTFRHLHEMDVMFDSTRAEIYGPRLLANQDR
uniref:G-protein coupled receptors family 1 profile domain-containing protein n=1 Tax=Eptatretus burgeri TaxID=7764 RepID=A0A8C4PX42_EPTBU